MLKKRGKQAQVTIFIAAGALFLVLIVLAVITSNVGKDFILGATDKPSFGVTIQEYVDSCVREISEEGLIFISMQGGYYNVPEPNKQQFFIKIPYYFDLGEKKFPSKQQIAIELSNYVTDKLPSCLNDFEPFKEQGYRFKTETIKTTAMLEQDVIINVNYPIKVIKGEKVTGIISLLGSSESKFEQFSSSLQEKLLGEMKSQNTVIQQEIIKETKDKIVKELNEFTTTIDINFNKVYSIVEETVVEQEINPNFVPIGHVSVAAHTNNFNFELSYLDDDDVFYTYTFEDYLLDTEPYTFIFGCRYDWAHLKPGAPEIDIEAIDQYCYVGDVCSYDLNIYEEEIVFEDYTELFEISTDGTIEFIPKQKDVGKHNILVKANTNDGGEKHISFELEIIPLNSAPEIIEIVDKTAKVGQPYTHQVVAVDEDDDEVIFIDDTELFDISLNGLIEFVPSEEDIGLHVIGISASDGKLSSSIWMYLTIE